jgi:glycosyltransferase involved in cell wall biosynthesis
MISVVIPCLNEKEVLDELYRRMSAAADGWAEDYEIIVVDDGSDDETWRRLQEVHKKDERWKLIRLSRNFGHQTALSAGLARARGDAVVLIDADLQDPPEVLQRFIDKWREGYQVVYAVRKKRKEGLLKRLAYVTFYRLLVSVSGTRIPLDSGDFSLMDRKVVDVLNAMPERNRFLRGLRAWVGFRQIGIDYERHARAAGEPQYTLVKLINLAVDGIFSFSFAPLRVATYFGFVVSGFAFLFAVLTLLQTFFGSFFSRFWPNTVPGYATTIIAILFLGGVQLLSLGVLGEYMGRTYEEVKNRPLWVVRETEGFEAKVEK